MVNFMSSADFLLDVFEENSGNPAFLYDDKEFSYQWLLKQICEWEKRLANDGVGPGAIVAVAGDYSPELCALLIALIRIKAVSVPFASVTGSERLELSNIANVGFTYTFEGSLLTGFNCVGTLVDNELLSDFLNKKSPGLIVFSSGSTGKPKAILHDFAKILEKFRTRRKTLRTLTFLQLDHLGGLNTLLYVLSNGGTVISVKVRDPQTVCRTIQHNAIELLPVTPSFLNLLIMSGEYKNWDMSSLKIISYGTEVMPVFTLERVRTLFPRVQFQQTYGLSELGVLRTKSKGDGSLWVKVGGEGFHTKVVDGILWIKAKSAMVGYLNAPQPFDSEGWFNTEDQVEVDGDYLNILGRRSDIISVGGLKVFPAEVESVLSEMENVRDVVVFGEKHFLMGSIVVATFNLDKEESLGDFKARMWKHCKERLSVNKIPAKVFIVTTELFSSRFKRQRTQARTRDDGRLA
jgi:acyl-CoA synthetase (AMP-forming)/AMP-acid ligase II